MKVARIKNNYLFLHRCIKSTTDKPLFEDYSTRVVTEFLYRKSKPSKKINKRGRNRIMRLINKL